MNTSIKKLEKKVASEVKIAVDLTNQRYIDADLNDVCVYNLEPYSVSFPK